MSEMMTRVILFPLVMQEQSQFFPKGEKNENE
jgi:hypothetical protein